MSCPSLSSTNHGARSTVSITTSALTSNTCIPQGLKSIHLGTNKHQMIDIGINGLQSKAKYNSLHICKKYFLILILLAIFVCLSYNMCREAYN